MLQIYRLRFAVAAQLIGSEPPSFESFDADELLLMLREEDGFTIFCRRDDAAEGIEGVPQFIASAPQFARWTEVI